MNQLKSNSAEVWITGIGLATSLGEGLEANWDALNARRINVDEKGFAPYIVHPWAPVNLDTQIPKKGDQRQMEAWQRIGTYAAGLALESAGVKDNKEILGRMDMIVAAGGGERDLRVDCNILNLEAKGNSGPGFLNERLMNDLRPTLFLAQLSNLLADSRRSERYRADRGLPERRTQGSPGFIRIRRLQSEGKICSGLDARERCWLCAWVCGGIPGDRVQSSRASARRQTLCAPHQRGGRPGSSQASWRG